LVEIKKSVKAVFPNLKPNHSHIGGVIDAATIMFTLPFPMKNSRPVLLSRPVVIASLIIGVALAVGTALLSSVSTRDIASASQRVAVTQKNLLELNQLRSSILDAETGQRGYILTGLDSYLQPYNQAVALLDGKFEGLRARYADPAGKAAVSRIGALLADKKAEMQRTIELRRSENVGPALHLIDSGEGLRTMNALREELSLLEQSEFNALARHSTSVSTRAGFFQLLSFAMLVVACVLGATGVMLFLRRMHELETMITVCAWTHRVKYQGEWLSFEEYLRRRFDLRFTHGISEDAAKKLEMEAIELVESDPLKFKARPANPA
jgi:CHASE3 domain sensor protein